MTSTKQSDTQFFQYSQQTILRGDRALRCSPFQLSLFSAMRQTSIPIAAIVGLGQTYTKHQLSELAADNHLNWLIQVGLLRREVDGQGITDSFRLTPLGRQLVEKYENQGGVIPSPSLFDRLKNLINRWTRSALLLP